MKKSFVFYNTWGAAVQNMSNEQAGQLIKAMLAYQDDKDARPEDPAVGFVFDLIAQKLDEDAQAYAETCAKRAEYGKRGGESKSKQKEAKASLSFTEEAKGSKSKQKEADTDTESDTDTETDKDIESARTRARRPSVDEVRAYCQERHNNIDAEQFVDFYTSKGWKVGKDPMTNWKAAVRTWEKRDRARSGTKNSFTGIASNVYDFSTLEKELVDNL